MNAQIQDLISENEKVIWEGTPDKVCYIWSSVILMLPFAVVWLFFDGFFIFMLISTGMIGKLLFFVIPFFALHLFPVWSVIASYIKNKLEYKNVVYAITDKRIIIRDGLIGIDFKSLDYSEINDVNVHVNILERIRKVGTIICQVQNFNYSFIAVQNPYDVFKMLQKISFNVKTDINYPNAERPENNPGYNSVYPPKDIN
jgi:membrane protein YdbS with pleckstrin-like domain